ncbi:MAG TPA: D-aminoacylase [Thermodesulfobacteriota bacterium]
MLDLLIRGGRVVDGTGRPAFRADVAIEGGRIRAVGLLPQAEARRVIDATGRVVAPGFLDLHSHSELALLADPFNPPKLEQGFTFELLGQDGLSVAPLTPAATAATRQALAGLAGDPPGIDWSWRSVDDFLGRLDGLGLSAGYLVPHAQLRRLAMGDDDRAPTPDELREMRRLLREGLEQGAFGLSTGLVYPPNCFAAAEELAALGEEVAAAGGIFAVHLRSEGAGIEAALDEMLEVARRSGCRLHVSHLKLAGAPSFGKLDWLIARLEGARAEGLEVTCDQYPYAAGSTVMTALVPTWALAGGPAALRRRLEDPSDRARIHAEMAARGEGPAGGFDEVVVSDLQGARPERAALVGKRLTEIAALMGVDPATAVIDLLRETRLAASIIIHNQADQVVRALLPLPFRSVGSDGLLFGSPHPRAYGTAPRILGRYVREERRLTLEEAVHSLTGRAADHIGLADRGRVLPGLRADLVVFDPDTIIDRATYERPTERPIGIDHVVVGGAVVVEQGRVVRSAARRGEACRARRR